MEHEKDPGWQYLKRSREQMLEVRLLFISLSQYSTLSTTRLFDPRSFPSPIPLYLL